MDILDTAVPGTVTLTAGVPVDAKGRPAKLDGVPVWTVQDGQTDLTLVSQTADGLSAVFHLTDNLFAAQATITGDADLGAGVVPITSTFVFNVVASDAVAFGPITASAVTPD